MSEIQPAEESRPPRELEYDAAAARAKLRTLTFSERIDLIIRFVLAVAVSIGCYFIVEPFLTAIVIAAILAVVTWPLFESARDSLRGSTTLPAVLMVTLLIVCVLIPSSVILVIIAQQLPTGVALLKDWIASCFALPPRPSDIP